MEDKTIKKLNIEPANLPEVPRTEAGKIDLEAITIDIDIKGNRIVPDDIFDSYYKELPSGTINQSKTWRAANNGKIKILNSEDAKIQRAGGIASQATQHQRRSIAESLKILLEQKADSETIAEYGLKDGATNQDAMIVAMLRRVVDQRDVAAFNSIRDTVGEKPSENINANINQVTPEQLELLEEFKKRATE